MHILAAGAVKGCAEGQRVSAAALNRFGCGEWSARCRWLGLIDNARIGG